MLRIMSAVLFTVTLAAAIFAYLWQRDAAATSLFVGLSIINLINARESA